MRILKILFLMISINLFSCSGGSSDTTTSGGKEGGSIEFLGLESVVANQDGTWTLWWKPVLGSPDIRYEIFKKENGNYDFTKPLSSTLENNYITADLRLVGNSCFVVRYTKPNSPADENKTEVCTNHEAYKFAGAEEITSLRDGTYVVRWIEAPFEGVQFQVFQRVLPSNEWKSLGKTTDAFYKSEQIALDQVFCFKVQYRIEGFPEDKNEKEVCTSKEKTTFEFAGIGEIVSPKQNVVRVKWTASQSSNVTGYSIYLGTDFKQKIADVVGKEKDFFDIDQLQHAVVYTFGVRSVDSTGREDANKKLLSFELKNHLPVIQKIKMVGSSNTRPQKLTCEVEYTDEDVWQRLKPTFKIINRKRDNLGDVERVINEGSFFAKKYVYELNANDDYRDTLICQVSIFDGFNTVTRSSADNLGEGATELVSYVVPDTAVVATGMNLIALANTPYDITLALGSGYSDEDQDPAVKIIVDSVVNGEILPVTGLVDDLTTVEDESRVFVCTVGNCNATFKPKKDFYTNLDQAENLREYAQIFYRVQAGNNISNVGIMKIVVRPVPRALGFNMVAQQDEFREFDVGLTNFGGEGKNQTRFAGYTYPLNSSPSKIYIRHPLTKEQRKGKLYLPTVLNETTDIFCRDVDVAAWNVAPEADGFECAIPCADFKCPLKFKGDANYYGMTSFEYAVVVDGIQSNYANVVVNVLPNLRASGFKGLTVQGQTFEITMKEGTGFQGAGVDIQVDNIVVLNASNNAVPILFSSADAGVTWKATFVSTPNFSGVATFEYRINGTNKKTGLPVESDLGQGTVNFYPLPIATGIETVAMEARVRELIFLQSASATVKNGYYNKNGDPAQKINVSDMQTSRGQLTDLGNGVSNGSKDCSLGQCVLEYLSPANYYDANDTSHLKLKYSITSRIANSAFAVPDIQTDAYLPDGQSSANATMVSNVAEVKINVRPVPKVINQEYAMRESTILSPSTLNISLASGAAYTHATGLLAKNILINTPPASGSLSAFICDTLGVCLATYSPTVGFVGYLTPDLNFRASVTDGLYTLDSGVINSDPGLIKIDVRPVPKPTGLSVAIPENTSFASSNSLIELKLGNGLGYTHSGGLLAQSATLNILPDNVSAINASTTAINCMSGVCSSNFTPNENFYGEVKLNYTTTVNDAKLGNLTSDPGLITFDVRPRPRTNDVGSESSRVRVDEDTPKTFTFALGNQYTHPYSTKAKRIEITEVSNGTTTPVASDICNATTGLCTVVFTPTSTYEGPAYFKYKVVIQDIVLGQELSSNISTVYMDVYPKPRATGIHAYVFQNSISPITIDLRAGNLLNEDAFTLKQRKGYTHRRDEKASSVIVSSLSAGSLTAFVCDTDGKCTANYTSGNYIGSTVTFNYKVVVGGLESIAATANIDIRPTATANELNLVMLQNTTKSIEFKLGTGLQYTHPLSIIATRIELSDVVGDTDKGTPTIVDMDNDNANTVNCNNLGTCKVDFAAQNGYYSNTNFTEAKFKYRVWTYDAELVREVPSNWANVYFNVRPRPVATGYALKEVQGIAKSIVFSRNGFYTYPIETTQISSINIVPNSAVKGTLNRAQLLVNSSGNSEAIIFTPNVVGGVAYYGQEALFKYKAVIFDTYLQENIESEEAVVTIDYRPKPLAQAGLIFYTWQAQNKQLVLQVGNGYAHPYYALDANLYKPSGAIVTEQPTSGSISGSPNNFSCVADTCSANYVANASFYNDGQNAPLTFKYKVKVFDPILLQDIESDEQTATITVKPIIVNVGKTVYGVQSVNKNLRLQRDSGFTYPLTLPRAPIVEVKSGSANGGSVTSPFVCDTTGCDAVFSPENANKVGNATFEYRLILSDDNLQDYVTEYKTYTVNFYPIPKTVGMMKAAGFQYKGTEGIGYNVTIIPADTETSVLCHAADHAGLAPKFAYSHSECDPAVELQIVPTSISNGTFASTIIPCDSKGKCNALFTPNVSAGSWPGYGIAEFDFKVRINPSILSGTTLSAAEQAALVSNASRIQVEFYPIPHATGLYTNTSEYIYGVQGQSQNLKIEQCDANTTLLADCKKGYFHGYNANATNIGTIDFSQTSGVNNLEFTTTWNCQVGSCAATLRPIGNYYTPQGSNATFKYNVSTLIDGISQTSLYKTANVKIYPVPIAQDDISYGLEGDDLNLSIGYGNEYTHPFGDKAVRIDIISSPPATFGQFVANDNSLIPVNGDLSTAFTCDGAGICTAKFRPVANLGSDFLKSFFYQVAIAGPGDMPSNLRAQLLSNPKEYKLSFTPKPIAQNVEFVTIEGESPLLSFNADHAYTHRTGLLAANLIFQNGGSAGTNMTHIYAGATAKGLFQKTGLTCSGSVCTISCNGSGACAGVFSANSGVYSNTSTTCAAVGANCPSIDFKPQIYISAGNLYASSDNTGTASFNVRPLPKVNLTSVPTYKAEEGESVVVQVSNGQGYDHPFYPASAIPIVSTTKGSLASNFVCNSGTGVCTATFVPSAFYPSSAEKMATIAYKATINDPTLIPQLGNIAVGNLTSNNQGTINIEYRAKPRTAQLTKAVAENATTTVQLSLGNGYTQEYGYLAKKVIIPANTQTNLTIAGCSVNLECSIPCNGSGLCSLNVSPNTNYYGNEASFNYHIVVEDPTFSTPRELQSPTVGTVTLDVRPLIVAQNLSYNVAENGSILLTVEKGTNKGYTRPASYNALTYNTLATTLNVVGSITNGTISGGAFSCVSGVCTTTLTPAANYFGDINITYNVGLVDAEIGAMTSADKVITVSVRPSPKATGFVNSFATRENVARTLSILEGLLIEQKGYYYPSAYNIHPKLITVNSAPNASIGSLSVFSCSTGADVKGCSSTFTPVANTYGTTSLSYSVTLTDPFLGDIVSNVSPINIDVRPIIRANHTSYVNNATLKAVEGQALNWTLNNGANLGFTYPLDAAYTSTLATLAIVTENDAVNGHGTIGSASCSAGSCSGVFNIDNNYSGEAKFKYTLSITDSNLPAGSQIITSDQKVATIDVYPLPVSNDTTFYTVEDTSFPLTLEAGAAKGFTHARSDNPTAIAITGGNPTANINGSAFVCSSGACSATYTPNNGFKSASASLADGIKLYYKVTVAETGSNPRSAQSKDPGTASIVVYPKALTSTGATHTNVVAWENEVVTVSISKGTGLGYTHGWNHNATGIEILSMTNGSTASPSCDGAGVCTVQFTPGLGSYGNGAAQFTYRIKTTYSSLPIAMQDVWSNSGTVTFNVRAVPKVSANPLVVNTMAENTSLTNVQVSLGNGYTYGDAANRHVSVLEVRPSGSNKISPSTTLANCVNGTCTFPTLTPENNYHRGIGMAEVEYRVKVVDDGAANAEKWSKDWQKVQFAIIPQAKAETFDRNNGVELTNFLLTTNIGSGNGYTHVENAKANKIKVLTTTNFTGIANNTEYNCTDGACSLILTPASSNFVDVSGKPTNPADRYGWAQVTYQYLNVIDGVNVWSTIGTANIYIRPAPRAHNVTIANAIENEVKTVTLSLNSGYTHPTNLKASSISVTKTSGAADGSVTSSSCTVSTGVCTLTVASVPAGTYTFDTKVTDSAGVEQQTASVLTVTFLPRHRNQNINDALVEGQVKTITIAKNAGYTHADNNNAGDVIISNINNGSITSGGTACAFFATGKVLCPCSSGSCQVEFTPTAWSDGEGVRTGSFKFQTRDISYKEADGTTPLAALASATVTLNMDPLIVTNTRSYPAGSNQGVEDVAKTVVIAAGSGGTSTGGYVHALNGNATHIRIESVTNATISGCSAFPCTKTCSAGSCSVSVVPLSGGSFQQNASFSYNILENTFESHIAGTASVYFYPRPVTVNKTQVVAAGTTTVVQVSPSAGYSHVLSDTAASWAQLSGSPGTLSNFACAAGVCTATYDPGANFSTSASDLKTFNFKVVNNAAHGAVDSNPVAGSVYSLEIFPKPVASSKTLKWVEGIGDPSKPSNKNTITIKLNEDYTHARGSNPSKINVTSVVGGAFTSAFACSGDTCTADFVTSSTSLNNVTAGAYFDYNVEIAGYSTFVSNTARVNIIVMPLPVITDNVAYEVMQATSGTSTSFKMALLNNLGASPKEYATYTHAWNSPINLVTVINAPNAGTLNTTANSNTLTYLNGSAVDVDDYTFTYKIRVYDATTGLSSESITKSGIIRILPAIKLTGVYVTGKQQLVNGSVMPNTTVPFTIEAGAGKGYTIESPSVNASNIQIRLVSVDNTGAVGAVSHLPGLSSNSIAAPINGQVDGTAYGFGYYDIQYQVCEGSCSDPNTIKTKLVSDKSKWMKAWIEPSDVPPTGCNKTGAGKVIVYKNITKTINMTKGAGCENGVWYTDGNTSPEDFIKSFKITSVSAGTIAGVTGTSCTGSNPIVCTCGTGVNDICAFSYTAPANYTGAQSLTYKVTTRSSLLSIDAESEIAATVDIDVVNPPTPVAEVLTATGTEDVALSILVSANDTNGSTPDGYLTIPQMNTLNGTSLLPAPDGYRMVASSVNIVSFNTTLFTTVTFTSCTAIGVCTISATPKIDANTNGSPQPSAITYNVVANGVTSANKTITVTINATDDAPNSYGLGQSNMPLQKRQFHNPGWGASYDGTFYQNGVGVPQTFTIQKLDIAGQTNEYTYWNNTGYYGYKYGYYDAENHNAVSVRTANVVGGTIGAFTCNASGVCTATFTPNGSIALDTYAYFDYWVTTSNGVTPLEQPAPSKGYILVHSGDTTTITAKNLPSDTPDITSPIYDANYTIAREQTLTMSFTQGSTALQQYAKSEFNWFTKTNWPTSIDIGNGSNGADAPANVTVDPNAITCANGVCYVTATALAEYAVYPAEASFYYRVNTSENYVHPTGGNYYNYLKKTSAWKKVTLKVVLTKSVGCANAPVLEDTNTFAAKNIGQAQTATINVGNGTIAGNFYSHTGTGANWRKLKELDISSVENGTASASNLVCTNGQCSFTFTPTGNSTPSNYNDDYIGQWAKFKIRAMDDVGCYSNTATWYVNVKPKVIARNKCVYDDTMAPNCINTASGEVTAAVGESKVLQFRKRTSQALTDYDAYEYETSDNSNATKIIIYDIDATEQALLVDNNWFSGLGTGSCAIVSGDLQCETTACSSGDCSITMNVKNTATFGDVNFKYKVVLADGTESRAIWARAPHTRWPNWAVGDTNWGDHWLQQEAQFNVSIKEKPMVTNPNTLVMGPNTTTTLKIGRTNVTDNVYGYNYDDAVTHGAQAVSIDILGVNNGQILTSSFDPNTKIQTLSFKPDTNFVGTATISYKVTVWGVASDTGTFSITVRKYLDAADTTISMTENTPKLITLTRGSEYNYTVPYAYEASNIEVKGEDYNDLLTSIGVISGASCDGNNNCTFTITPANNVTGTKTLKYRLESGPVGSKLWTPWKTITLDIVRPPQPPVVANMNLTGLDNQAKLISFSLAPNSGSTATYGYYDYNGDPATAINTSSLTNGTIEASSCSNGICLVSFKAAANYYGNASFNFAVTAGGDSSNTATVTVNFDAVLTATSVSFNGVKNVNKVVTVSLGQGYTYNPGALVNQIVVTSPVNGSIAEANPISCSSGICSFTFVPNNNFAGNATFNYTVRVTSVSKESTSGTGTISFANSDSAPVLASRSISIADHSSVNIAVNFNDAANGYTDLEGDKASAITIVSSTGLKTITGASCNGSGNCSFTVDPLDGYQGAAQVKYSVTANGLASNQATLSIDVSEPDPARSFKLVWNGSPILDDSCKIAIPGSIVEVTGANGCGAGTCSTYSGLLASTVTSSSITASGSSVNGTLNKFTTLGQFYTKWDVANSNSETVSLGRYLNLTEATSTLIKQPVVSTTLTVKDTMEGAQRLSAGCNGSSCNSEAVGHIAVGKNMSCTLMSDTRLMCWGSNDVGQLGADSVPSDSDVALYVRSPYDPSSDLYGAAAVTVGDAHACALLQNGEVVCWGSNALKQLGAGDIANQDTPVFVKKDASNNLNTIKAISAGGSHTCAVDNNKNAWCWGLNADGQLGLGTTANANYATKVLKIATKSGSTVNTTADLDNVFSISAGKANTCAIRLLTSGSTVTEQHLLCWGDNASHQVGDNNYDVADVNEFTSVAGGADNDRLYPTMVRSAANARITGVVSVAVGNKFACANYVDGSIKCWGDNSNSKLGINANFATTSQKDNPTSVVDNSGVPLTNMVGLSLGEEHACALKNDKTMLCWGANGNTQLGDNSTTERMKANSVYYDSLDQLTGVYAIAAGFDHTCAITTSGKVRCWGDNTNGELGNDTLATQNNASTEVKTSNADALDASLKECGKVYTVTVP